MERRLDSTQKRETDEPLGPFPLCFFSLCAIAFFLFDAQLQERDVRLENNDKTIDRRRSIGPQGDSWGTKCCMVGSQRGKSAQWKEEDMCQWDQGREYG